MTRDAYRPTALGGVVGQPTAEIDALIDGADTPNLLLHGPPGTGKTTVARIVSRRVQGDVSELMAFNASDDRGIDTVRDEIIPAASQTTLSGQPRVIFLDEMEAMTTDAQQALRNPMEDADAVFVLACNDVTAVHEALRSRCHVFDFDALDGDAIRERIRQVARDEGTAVDAQTMDMIVGFANGDMRSAIQRYQQVTKGATSKRNEIDQAARNLMD